MLNIDSFKSYKQEHFGSRNIYKSVKGALDHQPSSFSGGYVEHTSVLLQTREKLKGSKKVLKASRIWEMKVA